MAYVLSETTARGAGTHWRVEEEVIDTRPDRRWKRYLGDSREAVAGSAFVDGKLRIVQVHLGRGTFGKERKDSEENSTASTDHRRRLTREGENVKLRRSVIALSLSKGKYGRQISVTSISGWSEH